MSTCESGAVTVLRYVEPALAEPVCKLLLELCVKSAPSFHGLSVLTGEWAGNRSRLCFDLAEMKQQSDACLNIRMLDSVCVDSSIRPDCLDEWARAEAIKAAERADSRWAIVFPLHRRSGKIADIRYTMIRILAEFPEAGLPESMRIQLGLVM